MHSTPPLGGPCRTISIPFGMEKLEWWNRMVDLHDNEKKTLRMCITERLDTDHRRTDGHLPRQSPRYAYAMRGKNQ